jgi:hypothetical protein
MQYLNYPLGFGLEAHVRKVVLIWFVCRQAPIIDRHVYL